MLLKKEFDAAHAAMTAHTDTTAQGFTASIGGLKTQLDTIAPKMGGLKAQLDALAPQMAGQLEAHLKEELARLSGRINKRE